MSAKSELCGANLPDKALEAFPAPLFRRSGAFSYSPTAKLFLVGVRQKDSMAKLRRRDREIRKPKKNLQFASIGLTEGQLEPILSQKKKK
jgi:hypothetical protein